MFSYTNKNNYFEKAVALFVLGMLIFSFLPFNVYAAGLGGPGIAPEGQTEGIQAAHDSIANAASCFVSPTACISKFLAATGSLVLQGFGSLLTLSGKLFDASAEKALEKEIYSGQKVQVLQSGWTTVRDISNLFFIFILLVIAIATILRLEAYGVKTLLPRLIIIALLINFSFLFTTQYIIRPSNELAKVFYDLAEKAGPQGEKSISASFVKGLDPYKIYLKLDEGEIVRQGLVANSIFVFLSTMGGSILIILAAFVLFAAAIMFIMRIVILWILIILSPLAFLFMVLPATRGYASSWWKQLFNQSFFPIAFLFLFYLVVQIINGTGGGGTVGPLFGSGQFSWADYILQYVFLLILLFLTLVVSRNLGAYGANTMIGWGTTARRWATGYAGRLGARGVGVVATRPLYERTKGAREALATIMPRTAGVISRNLERAAKIGGLEDITKKRMEFGRKLPPAQAAEYFKKLGTRELGLAAKEFSAREVAEMLDKAPKPTQAAIKTAIERLPVERREAIAKEGANLELKRTDKEIASRFSELPASIQKSLLEQADKARIQKIAKAAEDEGMAKEFIKRLKNKEIGDVGTKKLDDVVSVLPHMAEEAGKEFADVVKDIDFEKVKADYITSSVPLRQEVFKQVKPKDIQKIIDRGDDLTDMYLGMAQKFNNIEEFAKHLEDAGNNGTANWARLNKEAWGKLGFKEDGMRIGGRGGEKRQAGLTSPDIDRT